MMDSESWVVWRTKGAKVLPVSLTHLTEDQAKQYAADWTARGAGHFAYEARPMCEQARAHFARVRENLEGT